MIQDIMPHIFHNEYTFKQPDADDYTIVFSQNKILMKEENGMLFPRKQELERYMETFCGETDHTYQYLFCIGRDNYFLFMDFHKADNIMKSAENTKKRPAEENAAAGNQQAETKIFSEYKLAGRGVTSEGKPADDKVRAENITDTEEINCKSGNMIVAGEINCKFEKMTDVREKASREVCFAAYTACHLYQWYLDNQFCGRCGANVRLDKKERMLYCPDCGNQIYPRIAPAVIVAVTDGDRILLSRYADREYKRYALIAGFTEIGETAEETVRREVMEEAGLHVKNIRYYKTQPWGIAGNLLIGYFAELDGDDQIHLDHKELAVARWTDRQELAGMDDGISLTREMMRVFYERREPL